MSDFYMNSNGELKPMDDFRYLAVLTHPEQGAAVISVHYTWEAANQALPKPKNGNQGWVLMLDPSLVRS